MRILCLKKGKTKGRLKQKFTYPDMAMGMSPEWKSSFRVLGGSDR